MEVSCDGNILDELRATLEETIAIAEQGSGGKKRRFDENWESVPQEPVRMRGLSVAQLVGDSDPVPRGQTSEKKRRPAPFRTQGQEAGCPKQRMKLAERKRSDLPHKLYSASAGQSVRRVFGDRYKPHAERNLSRCQVHGDRYRPAYK